MRRLRRFLTSVLHTRPRQLAWRARLIARRWAAERNPGPRRAALRRRAEALAADARPGAAPAPFPPRTCMYRRDGETIGLRFLGQELRFDGTIDWGLARGGRASHLWGFHLHYHEFLEEVGAEDFQAIVLDWIASNPPFAPGTAHDAWSAYALSLRVVVWMQQIARRREALTPGFVDAAVRSVAEQILFLVPRVERDLGGNHLVKNLKALLFAER